MRAALHTISSVPLDPEFPLFRHYPAMKLGGREATRFYAELLLPLAEEIVASRPEATDWVVTSPPLYAIPSGANLLAWELCQLLRDAVSGHINVRRVDLRFSLPNPRTADCPGGVEYSACGVEERIRNRQRLFEGGWTPRPDPAEFRDRSVLFINDITVTGAQQRFSLPMLESVRPASIHWLYIAQVESVLGQFNPELENSLNRLNLESFEELAELVARPDTVCTWRCIDRIMGYGGARSQTLLRSLGPTRRKTLRRLLFEEGAYTRKPASPRLQSSASAS